jgi:hypothetical protein
MPDAAEVVQVACNKCGARKKTKLTAAGQPRIMSQWGWKRQGEAVLCRDCWRQTKRLTAVILPIRPVDPEDWPELREVLRQTWNETTALANWAIHQLALADVQPTAADTELAKAKMPYLYGLAKESYPRWCWWTGQYQAANVILNQAQRRYLRDRLKVLWLRQQALATYRHGVPFPLDADAWSLERDEGGAYLFSCGLGGKKRTFVLATAKRGRLKGVLKQIVSGQAVQVEAALYERRATLGDHRAVRETGEPIRRKRLYAKLVCWLPRSQSATECVQRDLTLFVRTDRDSFWVALREGAEQPWILNADHVRGWVKEHMRRLNRMAEDMKYEKRWPAQKRLQIAQYREELVQRHRRRVDTWIHQATAALVGYAARQRVKEVVYSENETYVNPFPWHKLRTVLEQKLDAVGIGFRLGASGEVEDESPGDAREE